MGGGIMQMIKSAEDNYLIGNPKITFFKLVYHRHTNFAMENVEIPMNSSPTVNESIVSNIISKSGDLLHKLYYDIIFTGTASSNKTSYINWTNGTGYAYIKDVSIEMGGQVIDKHYSEWFDIWNELTDVNLNEHLLVNKHNAKNTYLLGGTTNTPNNLQMYIPLNFWFSRNPGLALPLISLQHTDVKLITTFRKLDYLINCDGYADTQTTAPIVKLFGNYIFLDTDERRRFSRDNHEYLIEQLQFLQPQPLSTKHSLNFNNHVKEIIWACRGSSMGETDPTNADVVDATQNIEGGAHANGNDYFNYSAVANTNAEYMSTNVSYEPFNTAKIIIEGADRFTASKASYFRTLQPLYHHSKVPEKHIYCYSFALKPEEYQPTGFVNFSKLNDVNLIFTGILQNTDVLIFARNYNVLRIAAGMGELAYFS